MSHAYPGNQGAANGLTAGDAFFDGLGSSVVEENYCESGSLDGIDLDLWTMAPDHTEVKQITNVFSATKMDQANFHDSLSIGKDLSVHQLSEAYNIVVLTYHMSDRWNARPRRV